jgi:hypothetical protein
MYIAQQCGTAGAIVCMKRGEQSHMMGVTPRQRGGEGVPLHEHEGSPLHHPSLGGRDPPGGVGPT